MDELFELGELLKRSEAEFGDVFAAKSIVYSVEFENERISEIQTTKNGGTGVRLLSQGNTIFSYTPGTLVKDASDCIEDCRMRAGAVSKMKGLHSKRELTAQDSQTLKVDLECLKGIDSRIRKNSSMVRQVRIRFKTGVSNVTMLSSEGAVVKKARKSTRFSVQVVVEHKGSLFTGYEIKASSVDAKKFLEREDLVQIGQEALRRALLQAEAVLCPAGFMPVILGGQAGGTMIHEACGHGLEADILEKDYSIYRGKFGQKVASELVTLVDDATLPDLYGSYAFDDEGTPAQRTILIENGILRRVLTDVETSMNMGLPKTGNGRRAFWSVPPMPRMTNTFIMNGEQEPEEIINSLKEGLLVLKMGGGEVHPTSGDFVFHVEEGYLVERGKVGKAVKNAILTGNGPEVLKRIKAVGNDLHFEAGVCGKSGQHVPVTDGQPTVLIDGLTVGGSDTANENISALS